MGKEISTFGDIKIGKKNTHTKIPIHLRYVDTEKV